MMFFKSKNIENNMKQNVMESIFLNSDDIEEIEMEEEQNTLTPQLPLPPTPEILIKEWFIILCNDLNINKYSCGTTTYYFGENNVESNNYPILSITYTKLSFKEFKVSLNRTEMDNLIAIFNKGINDYYLNIFTNKINDLKFTYKEIIL